MTEARSPVRVAILGGGVAGVTAAFALTAPEQEGRYDVTVYQMGWRLGGKGASGRNAAIHNRVEEHGLHIWFGCYDNAFKHMRACYEELGRDPVAPLATLDDAFKPQTVGTLMGNEGGPWTRWDIPSPFTTERPGEGEQPSLLGYLEMVAGRLIEVLNHRDPLMSAFLKAVNWLAGERLSEKAPHHELHQLARSMKTGSVEVGVGTTLAIALLERIADDVRPSITSMLGGDLPARVAMAVDLACAALIGLLKEGIFAGRPFQDLDDIELKAFLLKYGCEPKSLSSSVLRGYYDVAFAYKGGQPIDSAMDAAAGTALHAMLRINFGYRGALMWRMQAGMGDTIFGPYYEVLKKRGVHFRFFHRAVELLPTEDGSRVQTIRLARQADVVGAGEYEPLVNVGGLPCWPSEPLYDQLVQGAAIRRGPSPFTAPYNLDSRWSGWTDVGDVTLTAGADFDKVILAIPPAAHPDLCAALIAASPRWADMVTKVESVRTQAVQLWLKDDLPRLGWAAPVNDAGDVETAVVDAFTNPLNSFADMTHLVPRESWGSTPPGAIVYFCATLADDGAALPPPSDVEFPARELARARAGALEWLNTQIRTILPGTTRPSGFDWNSLVDDANGVGPERLASQYLRVNLDPSERYVLTTTGSTKHRLAADESGFDNLLFAGDWTDSGFCVGCVEAATMSALQASRAISGWPAEIPGEVVHLGAPKPSTMPAYITDADDEELIPPFDFGRLTMRFFPLEADVTTLQAIIDRHLNIAPPEILEYKLVGNFVNLQIAAYPYLETERKPEGRFTENEVSFNIVVAKGKRVNGEWVGTEIGFYFPFVFVDNTWAIATGREVFGYPKALGDIDLSTGPNGNRLLKMSTTGFEVEGPTEPLRNLDIIEITRVSDEGLLQEIASLIEEAGAVLLGPTGMLAMASPSMIEAFKNFAQGNMALVSLKQFRDAAQPDRACYQAIVSALMHTKDYIARKIIGGEYTVRINAAASLPIVRKLGIKVDPDGLIRPMQPHLIELDAVVELPENLYVAH